MIFRYRFNNVGAHTHVRLFAGQDGENMSFLGSLAFRDQEWRSYLFSLGVASAAMESMEGREKEFATMAVVAGFPSTTVQSVLDGGPIKIEVIDDGEWRPGSSSSSA